MLNVIKNQTIFPDYIKLIISKDLANKINELVSEYKLDVSEAVIYSLVENKNIKSTRRNSLKTSFRNSQIENLIKSSICVLVCSLLKTEYPNCEYNISIGTQSFDYIKYDNGGYFEPHRDWVRITNSQQVQYTLLLGLTNDKNNTYTGSTVLWIPVNYLNQYDYKILIESTLATEEFKLMCSKYSLPKDYEKVKELLETNKSGQNYIPTIINTNYIGSGLLFQSAFLHSGEVYYDWYKAKELLSIVINITGVESIDYKNPNTNTNTNTNTNPESNKNLQIYGEKMTKWSSEPDNRFIVFDEFESWMCGKNSNLLEKFNLFPFQIIISSGTYNNKKFNDKYLKYINLSDSISLSNKENCNILEKISLTLDSIYMETKNKLNKRGRETHIGSEIISTKDDLDNWTKINQMYFDITKLNIYETDIENIRFNLENYIGNSNPILIPNSNTKITRFEEILNTWEESGCNDDGDEYDETTYLNCQIDIKFCFFKL